MVSISVAKSLQTLMSAIIIFLVYNINTRSALSHCRYGVFSLYSLDGNGITDKGAGMLAKALKVNRFLQNLRSATALYYRSMSCMPAACDIVVSSMFSRYSLDGNRITNKGVGMLADALKVNQSLESLRSVTALYFLHASCMCHCSYRYVFMLQS